MQTSVSPLTIHAYVAVRVMEGDISYVEGRGQQICAVAGNCVLRERVQEDSKKLSEAHERLRVTEMDN